MLASETQEFEKQDILDRRKADRRTDRRTDGQTDSPCVLQNFVPFGATALLPVNLNYTLLKQGTGTADHLLPLGCYFLVHQAQASQAP